MTKRVLILGGTGEACSLADQLAAADFTVTYALAGRTKKARIPTGATVRVGGFGGDAAFAAYVQDFDAVIDATHPFAANMHRRCAALRGPPCLRLQRPAWQHTGQSFASPERLAIHLERLPPQRLFLALGSFGWQPFAAVKNHRFFLRGLEELSDLPHNFTYARGKPEPNTTAEAALFRRLSVSALITRNAGGPAGLAKLNAAAQLGLTLLVIERPPLPNGLAIVTNIDGATDWLSQLPS